jgi:ketosteroid isomerase-like protein
MEAMDSKATWRWLAQLFSVIDAGDTPRFLELLTEDCEFRFGNLPAVHGKQEIGAAVAALFASIAACRHEFAESWALPDRVICHGQVTYTRKDASLLTVPFANVLTLRGERICRYLIFVDLTQLYAAPASAK